MNTVINFFQRNIILTIIIAFLLSEASYLIGETIVGLFGVGDSKGDWYIYDIVSCSIGILVFGYWFLKINNKSELVPRYRDTGIINLILIYIAMTLSDVFMNNFLYLSGIEKFSGTYDENFGSLGTSNLVLPLLSIVILGPIFEELIFRGIIFKTILKKYNFISAAIISSIAFGVFHMDFYQGVSTLAAGFIWAFIYYKFGKIWVPILFHMLNNGISTAYVWMADTGMADTTTYESSVAADYTYMIIGLLGFILILCKIFKSKYPKGELDVR